MVSQTVNVLEDEPICVENVHNTIKSILHSCQQRSFNFPCLQNKRGNCRVYAFTFS